MASRGTGTISIPSQRLQPSHFVAAFKNLFSPFIGPRTPGVTLKSQRLSLIYISILQMTYTTAVPVHLRGVVHDPKVDALLGRLDTEFDLCYTGFETGSDDTSSEVTLVEQDEDVVKQDTEGEFISGEPSSSPAAAPSCPTLRQSTASSRRRDADQPGTMLLCKWQMANKDQLRRIASMRTLQGPPSPPQQSEHPVYHTPTSIMIADCTYAVPQTNQQRIQLAEAVFGQVLTAGEVGNGEMDTESSDADDNAGADDSIDPVTETVNGRELAPAVASYRDSLKGRTDM